MGHINTRKTLTCYAFIVIFFGILSFFVTPTWTDSLIGLLIGAFSASINLLLLHLAMKFLMSEKLFLSVQTFVVRILIYIAGAFATTKLGITSAIFFAASVIGISIAILLVYGIGGMKVDELGARVIWSFFDGALVITESTLFGLIVAAVLAILGIWLGSRLEEVPRGKQIIAEFLVGWVYKFTEDNMGQRNRNFAPYVGTILAFAFCASSLGVFGLRPITADLNVTGALALLTFLMIFINSIRVQGIGGKLKHMCDPYPFMFPLKVMEEVALPVSLALRMFGNILGGYIIVELWLHLMAWLSSMITEVPFLRAVTVLPLNAIFDIAEPAIQAFIFTILTVINLTAAMHVSGSAEE